MNVIRHTVINSDATAESLVIHTRDPLPRGTVIEIVPFIRPEPNELVLSNGDGTFIRGVSGTRPRSHFAGSIMQIVGIAEPENSDGH